VLDAKTNDDITSKVLTQILLEYEPVKLDLFSNELLTRAIRVNDRLLKDFVDVYFRQAFEAFCGSQNLPSAPSPASESNVDPGSAGLQNEIVALRKEVSKLRAQFKLRNCSLRKKQTR
jgi:hypothetical protein